MHQHLPHIQKTLLKFLRRPQVDLLRVVVLDANLCLGWALLQHVVHTLLSDASEAFFRDAARVLEFKLNVPLHIRRNLISLNNHGPQLLLQILNLSPLYLLILIVSLFFLNLRNLLLQLEIILRLLPLQFKRLVL